MDVHAEPLTGRAFALFGSVFTAPEKPGRSPPVAELLTERVKARATLTLSLEDPPQPPHVIGRLEHHPYSTQTFIPLDLSRYLVVVAPTLPNGRPSISRARAFVGWRGQGISYVTGLWHAAFTVLDRRGSYAALIWRDGSPDDEVFIDLEETLLVSGVECVR
jgi:ureidoglycolate lyase